jgi:PQQ-dependent dehydrogenase (s-GDH family)
VYSNGTGALTNSAASAFSITATTAVPPTPPGNDDCADAYLMPIGTVCLDSRGTLTGATTSSGIPIGTCTGTADDDVWYKFVAQKSNPTITISSIPTAITSTGGGAVLQLLTGTDCTSLTSVACTTNTSTTLAYTASGLTVGATYYVRVFSKNAVALSSATFDICVTMPTPEVVVDSTSTLFNTDIVGRNLGYPWEITYGPDDSLWITEARGYRVLRMSSSRTSTESNILPQQILKIPLGGTQVSFDRSVGTWPQGGMQGLAIHPEFATDPSKQFVYLSYVYGGTCPASASSACIFRTKIVRCQFYYANDVGNPTSIPKRDTLVILDTVISNLSGSNDHNSGRLKIGPVKEGTGTPTYKLYYTIGDMGAGQFNNTTRTNYALTLDTLEGKVLRLNTEPDGDGVPGSPTHDFDKYRQWIPNDNPFTHSILTTLRTPVYSYGHRNPQGLAWGNVNGTWRLYSSEHGDRSDDEVNIIESGANYGWPKITGKADDNYNTTDDAGDGFTMNNILANGTVTDEKSYAAAHLNYKDPLFDFLNWSAAQIETINTGNIFTWPTIAPSSIEFYNSSQIPGWKNSLLVTSLKYGMFRLKLNAAGTAVDSTTCTNAVDTFPLFHGWRVRDIAVSPNGGYIWAVIDSSGSTSGPTGGFGGSNVNTKDGGRVIRLSFKNMTTLPVHFLSFSGRLLTDKTVRLFWEATTDQSHSYFDVERSTDNVNFISLGHVSSGPPYNFIDYTPNIGNNYYRIRQVNSDGVSKFSRVINVPYEPYSFIVSAYPNPIQDQLTIRISAPGRDNLNVTVTDVSGRTVYSSQNIVDRNVTTLTIDTRTWASQMYLLKCTNQDNKVVSVQKVMKQ